MQCLATFSLHWPIFFPFHMQFVHFRPEHKSGMITFIASIPSLVYVNVNIKCAYFWLTTGANDASFALHATTHINEGHHHYYYHDCDEIFLPWLYVCQNITYIYIKIIIIIMMLFQQCIFVICYFAHAKMHSTECTHMEQCTILYIYSSYNITH